MTLHSLSGYTNYHYHILQQHHITFNTFFAGLIITQMLAVRMKIYEQIMLQNDPMRHDASNIIMHCWYRKFKRTI